MNRHGGSSEGLLYMCWLYITGVALMMLAAVVTGSSASHNPAQSNPHSMAVQRFSASTVLPSLVNSGSAMASREQTFDFANAGNVTVAQDWSGSLGGSVWHAGIILAHFIDEHFPRLLRQCASAAIQEATPLSLEVWQRRLRHNITGCSAVEIGSGATGLASLVVSRLGGRAIATDGDAGVLLLLQRNLANNIPSRIIHEDGVAANRPDHWGATDSMRLEWGSRSAVELTQKKLSEESSAACEFPDIVVAADVVYPSNSDAWGPLLDTFEMMCGPSTVALLAHTRRATEVRSRAL